MINKIMTLRPTGLGDWDRPGLPTLGTRDSPDYAVRLTWIRLIVMKYFCCGLAKHALKMLVLTVKTFGATHKPHRHAALATLWISGNLLVLSPGQFRLSHSL